jgi:hypothetical protein
MANERPYRMHATKMIAHRYYTDERRRWVSTDPEMKALMEEDLLVCEALTTGEPASFRERIDRLIKLHEQKLRYQEAYAALEEKLGVRCDRECADLNDRFMAVGFPEV